MPGVEIELPTVGDPLLANNPGDMIIHRTCLPDNHSTLSPPSAFTLASRPRRSYGSLSFLSSSTYRSDYLETPFGSSRRTMDRSNVNISPFRSVRQMKEPFQLKLPQSPSFDHRESKEIKSQPRGLQSPIGLPPLRSCRSDQNLVVGALETFGLLPSPSLSDSRITLNRKGVAMQNESTAAKCACASKDERCEICFLESYESETRPPVDGDVTKHPGDLEEVSRVHAETFTTQKLLDPISTPQMHSNATKLSPCSAHSNKRTTTTTVSSAASWALGDLTYCESWLQGVPLETPERNDEKAREANRRKCQIVQQTEDGLQSSQYGLKKPVDLRIDTSAANSPVMLAVASKSKPKLVDISRPSSSGTTFSIPIHPPPSWRRPSTPERRSINEISAFSPDTPQDIPDSGYVTQQSNRSSEESHEYHDDDYVDGSLDTRASSDLVSGKPRVKHGNHVSCYKRQYTTTYARQDAPLSPSAVSPKNVEQESLEKWWDYEWTLDQLEASIKEFPKQTLRLTSPVIILIRRNHEKALIRPFRKIFPGVPDNLIDYLCAALIAKNYLVSMASTHHRLNKSLTSSPPQLLNNLSKLDSVPEKARATLGITLPTSTKFYITDRLVGTRSLELQKGLDRIVDKLLYTICARKDETLKASVTVLTQVLEAKA